MLHGMCQTGMRCMLLAVRLHAISGIGGVSQSYSMTPAVNAIHCTCRWLFSPIVVLAKHKNLKMLILASADTAKRQPRCKQIAVYSKGRLCHVTTRKGIYSLGFARGMESEVVPSPAKPMLELWNCQFTFCHHCNSSSTNYRRCSSYPCGYISALLHVWHLFVNAATVLSLAYQQPDAKRAIAAKGAKLIVHVHMQPTFMNRQTCINQ